jgi:hypothetical protein
MWREPQPGFVGRYTYLLQPAARASTSRSVTSGYSSVISATPGVLER